MTVFAVQSSSDHSVAVRSISCRHTLHNRVRCHCQCDTPKWTAIISAINIWHGILALILIGQYNEIIAFVCANFACVILALCGVCCKKPAMLAPNVAVKVASIIGLPLAVIYLKIKTSQTSLNSEETAVLVWLVIVEVSLVTEVILTCNAFKKIGAADRRLSIVIEDKTDPPPAYAIAIIDTELPTYEEAVKLAQAQAHRPIDTPVRSNETVLVFDTL